MLKEFIMPESELKECVIATTLGNPDAENTVYVPNFREAVTRWVKRVKQFNALDLNQPFSYEVVGVLFDLCFSVQYGCINFPAMAGSVARKVQKRAEGMSEEEHALVIKESQEIMQMIEDTLSIEVQQKMHLFGLVIRKLLKDIPKVRSFKDKVMQ
jgi:hypothetical protein